MARLYIVSTPIGNLGDVTYRAIEVLRTVDRVLAEDTRHTKILLRHYGIERGSVSAHAHNEASRAEQLLGWLAEGQTVALVSDAGTPLISDPGARIVQKVIEAGHAVEPIPGPSAVLAALVASGLAAEPFTYYGFPARSGGPREARLAEVGALAHTAILYEAPSRVSRLLRDLMVHCGSDRRVVVARELTKLHETFFRGTLEEAYRYYERDAVRGEVVVLIAGRPEPEAGGSAETDAIEGLARELIAAGGRPSAVAREVSRRLKVPRNRVYEIVLSLSGEDTGEN